MLSKTDNPLISIIVPCYNQAQYMDECLDSVLKQTYQNWECIIVNDGSPDNTKEVALKWCALDNRIKYISKGNEGVATTRNRAISESLGAWILPLDADDIISKLYLEKAVKAIQENPSITLIYCKARKFGLVNEEWCLPEYNLRDMLIENCIFCTAFFKKEDWKLIGGYDTKMKEGREDWEFWINLLGNREGTVIRLDYVGFHYRIKTYSRNIDFFTKMEQVTNSENYIYIKHQKLYSKEFGSFINILKSNRFLAEKEKRLNKIEKNILYRIYRKLKR